MISERNKYFVKATVYFYNKNFGTPLEVFLALQHVCNIRFSSFVTISSPLYM